jgi:predicted NBD/HSP70 family sugar kinase
VWDVVAHSLASLCATLVYIVSPEKIVLSGGVMLRECLYPKVQVRLGPGQGKCIIRPCMPSSDAGR